MTGILTHLLLDISLAMTPLFIKVPQRSSSSNPPQFTYSVKSNVNVSTYLASFRFFIPLPKYNFTKFNNQDDIQYLPSLKAYIS